MDNGRAGTQKMRLTLVALVLFAVCVVSAQSLEKDFFDPPHAAQPWVYWDVLDGHFTREGITADLESMKRAGIGGVIQMHIGGHVPLGEVEFMGDTWRSNFVHAVLECERLGLEFTTITGPGWTGSGGPWIKVDQSMQHLVHAGVNIEGPAEFNQVLPKPPLHFTVSENKHNDRMRKDLAEFYEDVAVYAFPHREPVIEDVDEKALYLRRPYTSMEGVRTHLPSPVSFPEPDKSKVIEPGEIIDLTNRLQADGRLQWDVPAGEWTILRMGRRSTGSNTRPAPEAGLGFESNKFDKAALNTHFETYFDPLLELIGPRPKSRTKGFTGLDADSWEMGAQNWTPGFREEFKKRRGYDGWDYFPVYSGRVIGSREISERFLWDVRMTCQE
ncbi:MAG: glycosyl hydrolase, partial [Bacteroidetes bacterium]|nr:glycosyl hydrolase [Bacteroidota bacterium]